MSMTKQLREFATRRTTRRLTRAIRRKGLFGGTVDTALDFTPVVGSLKNLAEVGRGRDFIRDKVRPEAPRLT